MRRRRLGASYPEGDTNTASRLLGDGEGTAFPPTVGGKGACGPRGDRAVRLCLDRLRPPGPRLQTSRNACEFFRDQLGMASRDRESFVAVSLDARNRIIAVDEVAKGHLTGVDVHPRELFKGAILANAARLIVAHNHPSSGESEPSPQDIALTERLRQAGAVVGIPVVDHIVVGAQDCVSFTDRGIIRGPLAGTRRRR